MFFCDLYLDELVLGKYVRVVRVAVCVKSGKRLETLVGAVVVTEPSALWSSNAFYEHMRRDEPWRFWKQQDQST